MNLPAKELFRKLYFGIDQMPSWNPTVIEAKIIKKIDDHTDITYSVSAPGGGGLVDSRDFVNLRTWQLIKNGNVMENIDSISDDKILSSREASPQIEENVQQVQRSASEQNLVENEFQRSMDQSVTSLSKSLGAKVFSEDSPQSPPSEMFNSKSTTDDADEFVDANESQGAHSTNDSSHRSEEAEHITNIVNDLCDKMYIMSGVSIKYERVPTVSKYTR